MQPELAMGTGEQQAAILRDLLVALGRGQEPHEGLSSPKLTLFLQFLNGLPPLGPLVVGRQQEEVAL